MGVNAVRSGLFSSGGAAFCTNSFARATAKVCGWNRLTRKQSSPKPQCLSFSECAKFLEEGKEINYEGQSGPIDFQSNGDPGAAVMGIYKYGDNNKYKSDNFIEGDVPPPSGS